MIYRGPGFLPHLLPLLPLLSLLFFTLPVYRRSRLLAGEAVEVGGREVKSNDGKKDWSSINHSILSESYHRLITDN
jgi:hypothetical protein